MKKVLSFTDFQDAFRSYDRLNQFTTEGLKAVFNYLEQYEEDADTEIELDVIALCCEFSEFDIKDALESYNAETLEELQNNYNVIVVNSSLVIMHNC